MRVLLASPLGFAIGLSLGALGAGGSILAVPVLVYVAGQDPRRATSTSLLLVGVTALVGLVPHARARRVRVGTGVAFGLTGVGGSIAGSAVNRHVDPDLLLLGFAALICIAAWRMLTACPTCTRVGEANAVAGADRAQGSGAPSVATRLATRDLLAVVGAGTAVGFLTGLFGVGGGFVIVPALTLVLHIGMAEAIGTSLLVIAVNAAVALSTRVATTGVDWAVAGPFAVSAIAGVIVGGRYADRLSPERSLRGFAGLLVAVAVYTAIRAVTAMIG